MLAMPGGPVRCRLPKPTPCSNRSISQTPTVKLLWVFYSVVLPHRFSEFRVQAVNIAKPGDRWGRVRIVSYARLHTATKREFAEPAHLKSQTVALHSSYEILTTWTGSRRHCEGPKNQAFVRWARISTALCLLHRVDAPIRKV